MTTNKSKDEMFEFKTFNAIDEEYLHTDKHIHTTWGDGRSSVAELIAQAERIGLKQIAFTEHIRSESTYFPRYLKEIESTRSYCDIDILVGFEAKIMNFSGAVDVSKSVIKKANIKIASVHRFPLGRKLVDPSKLSKGICQEIELELAIAAIKKRECNVLGHAGGMSLKSHNEFPADFFEEIIIECKKNDVAFDLNSFYHMPVIDNLKKMLRIHNPYVSFGSDAHHVNDLGGWIQNWA